MRLECTLLKRLSTSLTSTFHFGFLMAFIGSLAHSTLRTEDTTDALPPQIDVYAKPPALPSCPPPALRVMAYPVSFLQPNPRPTDYEKPSQIYRLTKARQYMPNSTKARSEPCENGTKLVLPLRPSRRRHLLPNFILNKYLLQCPVPPWKI